MSPVSSSKVLHTFGCLGIFYSVPFIYLSPFQLLVNEYIVGTYSIFWYQEGQVLVYHVKF